MPRSMPAGLMELLDRPDTRIETHTTLQILIDNGDIFRAYHFATASLTIRGSVYQPELRQGSEIRQTLTTASDLATAEVQNVDTRYGLEFLALGQAIYGARFKLGRHWKDLDSGMGFHKVLLSGPLVSQPSDDNV